MNKKHVGMSALALVLSMLSVKSGYAEDTQAMTPVVDTATNVTGTTGGNESVAVDQHPQELKEMVVTATKTAKVLSEAPATVTVVTAKEIANKNAQRVEEALSGAPGVFIRGLGGEQPSNYQNQITLRGIPGYYRTGVLIDGMAINNAFSGGVNMSLVPVDDIKQIEVVPGPFSSLYGGSGMSGIINIITRMPEKREVTIKGDAGSHHFSSLSVGYRDRLSDLLGVSLFYANKKSDGFVSDYVTKTTAAGTGTVVSGWTRTTTSSGATTYIVGDKGSQAWVQDNVGAKLYLNLSPVSKLIFDASYLTHKTKDGQGNNYLMNGSVPFTSGAAVINGQRATINATDFLSGTTGENLTRYAASYETPVADAAKLKVNLSYQNNHYWYTSITTNATNSSGSGSLSDIPNKKLDGDVQLSFPVADSQYLLLGVSANNSTLNKNVYSLTNWRNTDNTGTVGDWSDGGSHSIAAYVQDELAVSDKLTVYGGARYERWSTNGTIFVNSLRRTYETRTSSALNPKVSAVYKVGQGTVIKSAIGKAFRAPNLSDMYSSFGTTTIYWSNPDLKPEKVTTAELSLEHEFETGTSLRGTYYRSNFSDLIYTSTPVAGNSYKFNAGKAETKGLDLEARQKLMGTMTAFVNATFVTTRITENAVKPASVGKQIPLQAQRMANIGVEGSYGSWAGSLMGTYVGKMYSNDDNSDVYNNVPGAYDPYFIANAKLAYMFTREFKATFSVNNLFGREYFQGGSKSDGRSVYLGLGYRY